MQTAFDAKKCKYAHMDDQIFAARALVHTMMEATALTPTELARKAGIVPSTLTRFLNKPVKHTLSARTIAKLAVASGMSAPSVLEALGLQDHKPTPCVGGVDVPPHTLEDIDGAALWRTWSALSADQQQMIAAAMRVMVLSNRSNVTHGDNPVKSGDKKGTSPKTE